MTDVTYQNDEYKQYMARATVIDDVILSKVKGKGEDYLPKPNAADTSAENQVRYDQYQDRAVFTNYTGTTKRVLVGAAFAKSPKVKLASAIEIASGDIDGAGVTLVQQSQGVVGQVSAKGRHCLYVDYPQTEGDASKADQEAGYIRAVTLSIKADRVINWKVAKVGAKTQLSLVVFKDNQEETTEDGFGSKTIEQYRVLKLVDGVYTVEIHRKDKDSKWFIYDTYVPLDGNARVWNEIPFIFVGSENNEPSVDESPLYDLAMVNIAHYRNSADYEDSVYFCGQVQPYATGLTPEWVDLLEKQGVQVGSRKLLPFPEGATFGYAQAQPNMLAKEAMDGKEKQMAAIGARILTPGSAVKTATEAQGDQEAQHSVLSLVASNVSQAYRQCLEWMLKFMRASGDAYFEINQDFNSHTLDAQKLTALIQLFLSGKYPESDFWAQLKKHGLIDPEKEDKVIAEETENTSTGLGLDDDSTETTD